MLITAFEDVREQETRDEHKARLEHEILSAGRAALIVNSRCRNGKRRFNDTTRLLEQGGFELDPVLSCVQSAQLPGFFREAQQRGQRLIIVGGGDGTISSVLPHLVRRDLVLGILPLGTANSFARSLGIAPRLEDATDTLVHGKVVDVDVGRIGERYFTTVASVGLAAKVARHMPPVLKQWFGRLAYPIIGMAQLRRYGSFRCMLESGDERHVIEALEVRVANAPYQAGIEVAPEASAESRELVVQVTTGRSLRELVGCWIRLTAGFGPDPDKTVTLRARSMRIDSVPRQYVSMDGEAFIHTPFHVEVAQQALLMMAPRMNPELH